MPSTWQGKALIGNQDWAASWGLRDAGSILWRADGHRGA